MTIFIDNKSGVPIYDQIYTQIKGQIISGALPLAEAHAIAERVHDDIEAEFPKVKHIMIHVNPA